MKKVIILCLAVAFIIFAATIELPSSITGFAVKAASTLMTVARQVLKAVLTTIANML